MRLKKKVIIAEEVDEESIRKTIANDTNDVSNRGCKRRSIVPRWMEENGIRDGK